MLISFVCGLTTATEVEDCRWLGESVNGLNEVVDDAAGGTRLPVDMKLGLMVELEGG